MNCGTEYTHRVIVQKKLKVKRERKYNATVMIAEEPFWRALGDKFSVL
jgi:hypothetical protein